MNRYHEVMKFLGIIFFAVPLMAQQSTPAGTSVIPLQTVGPATATIDPNKVVLQVNDIQITAQQLEWLIDAYPMNAQVFFRGPGRQQLADLVVRTLVLAGEARKRKLDESERFKEQVHFSADNLLANLVTQDVTANIKPDDAALRGFLEQHSCEYETWHPRQIVVRGPGAPLALKPGSTELTDEQALAKAKSLREKAVAGADFASLALEESDDTTAAKGGDLGSVKHGQIIPTLEEAVCKMKSGEISQPIKTAFGYHIVLLESKELRPFDEVKVELEQRLRPELVKKAIDELVAGAKVVKDPEYYAPPQTVGGNAEGPKKP